MSPRSSGGKVAAAATASGPSVLALTQAAPLFAALGDAARRVAFVYVTVDPERDTPAVLRTFLDSVDPRFEGLYVQGDRLAPLLAAYHVTVRKRLPDPQAYARRNVDPSTYYTMDHTSGFWLIDQDANLRMRLAHDAPASALVAGVERLLDTGIHVDAAEVRVLPSHAGAFYARIANDSGDADRLTSVDSPEVEDAQLHEVFNAGGVTSMREAPGGFPLPAHSALLLQRGGRHVMLFGAHPGGDRLPLTLHFEHGRSLLVDAAVRSALDSN